MPTLLQRTNIRSSGSLAKQKTSFLLFLGIFKQLRAEAKIGRAEALRRSIGALVDNSEPHFAYPAFWAPFVLVGDGRRGS